MGRTRLGQLDGPDLVRLVVVKVLKGVVVICVTLTIIIESLYSYTEPY